MPARGVLRAVVRKASLLVFGCSCGLLLGEVALRLFGYAGDSERDHRVFEPRYGAVPKDSWIWNFEIDPRRHQAVDLRGQFVPLAKPPGEMRVLFIGDSATEGAFVEAAQAYPAVFGRALAGNVSAINAGVWGMTTIDEYHLLADKLLPLRPDVVVLGLFMANDINMNLGHRELARGDRSGLDWLRGHSALVHFVFLRLLALSARGSQPSAANERGWLPVELSLVDQRGLHLLSYPEGELATYVVPESRLVAHAYEVLARVLRDLQALGKAHGFKLRVLLIPSPSRVLARLAILHYPSLLAELTARGVSIAPGDIDVDAATRRVLGLCERLALACVDPTPELQRLGARAFFPHDEHPTAAGHHALAQALLAH
jgi:hypothetical protein